MKIAIYSRKSKYSTTGDSIENQLQMCKDFIQNKYKGQDLQIDEYEDEGYSGGNLNRPRFQELINKVSEYDVLICYRLDRISRNVADFSSTLSLLQNNNCDFVSIKEQFDTSSPMGRAMIYIASVFAQLERETIAERVKDNMMELAKTGRWLGGTPAIGFDAEPISFLDEDMNERTMSKLKPNSEELKIVKLIYSKYLELGSMSKLETFLLQNNYKTKKGKDFKKSSLRIILNNPIYVKANDNVCDYLTNDDINIYGEVDGNHGLLTYNKLKYTSGATGTKTTSRDKSEWIAAVAKHQGIIEADKWLEVQHLISKNKETFPRLGRSHTALLTKVLRCDKCKSTMTVNHGHVNPATGKKHYYYNCTLKKYSKNIRCNNKPAKVAELDEAILIVLEDLFKNKKSLIDNLRNKSKLKKDSLSLSNREPVLKKSIEDKKKQIDNLVTKLSLDADLTDILMSKIKSLKNEINLLEEDLIKLYNESNKIDEEEVNLDFISMLLDKCSIIRTLDIEEQQFIIETMIPEVTWNGDTEDFNIYPLGSEQIKSEVSKKK
ncbi:MAG: recombinase family protein [Clostridium sp.]|uniref:recombinase family protein n=1 Tax=Clostridium sp. TaxID=1506 RepID=UPI003068E0D8